jgi:hypothetical protein
MVRYSQLRHRVSYPTFLFEYGLRYAEKDMEQRLNHTCSGFFFIDNEQANKKTLVPFFVQRVLYSLVIFKNLKDESHKNRKRNKGPCFYCI